MPCHNTLLSRNTHLLPLLAAAGVVGVALLIASPNFRWSPNKGENPYGSDFLQDWTAANMIASGQTRHLYNLPQFDAWQHDPERTGFRWAAEAYYPPVYPPPYYLLVSPLGLLPYRVAAVVWLAAMLGCLVAACIVIECCRRRPLALPVPRRAMSSGQAASSRQASGPASVWLAVGVLLFPPVLLSLSMGQKGPVWLLLWGISWGLLHQRREFAAGLVFGLLSLKPTLFFLFPLLMAYHSRWRFVLAAGLSWCSLWLAAAAVMPGQVWPEFLQVAAGTGSYSQHAGYQWAWSCTLRSLAQGLPPLAGSVWWGSLVLSLPAVYVLGCLARPPVAAGHPFDPAEPRFIALAILGTCLFSPHFYAYDLMLLLLPIWLLWHTHRGQAVVLIGCVWIGMSVSQLCLDTAGLSVMPLALLAAVYCLSAVTPGQSSVRKGVSGNPAPSNILHTGLSAQA